MLRSAHRKRSASPLLAAALIVGSLGACGDATGTKEDLPSDQGTTREITTLGYAPAPSRLVARNGSLFWLDASDVPLNRLSISDGVYTPYPTLPIPENAVSDGQNVYWVSGGRLYRTSTDGMSTTLLDERDRDVVSGVTSTIVMDDQHVYWATTVSGQACSPACTFTITQVSKAGGAATTLASTSDRIVGLAIAGGYVYWEEENGGPVNADGSNGSAIRKVALADGTVTLLVDGRLNGLIPPPSPGYAPASWHPRGGITSDGARVYFADADFVDSYRLMSIPVGGGVVDVLMEVTTGDGSSFVRDMELDAGHLYWADRTTINVLTTSGTGYTELAGGLAEPVSLALAGETLFWLETLCCAHGQTGAIKKVHVGGGSPSVVRTGLAAPERIAADPLRVYWVEGEAFGVNEGFGRIGSVGHDGTVATTVVESARGGPFDVDDTHLYFADAFTIKRRPLDGGQVERLAIGGFYVVDIATDGTHVYWVEDPEAAVRKVSVAGGPVTTLGTGAGPAGRIRLDDTYVYWLNHEDTIRRVPKEGGTPVTVVGPVTGGITDFVVSSSSLYYAEWDGGRIRSVSRDGGDASTLASPGADQTRRLATDGQRLYWIDQSGVMAVPVDGGEIELIIGAIAGDPLLASVITLDESSLYWTETSTGALRMARPK